MHIPRTQGYTMLRVLCVYHCLPNEDKDDKGIMFFCHGLSTTEDVKPGKVLWMQQFRERSNIRLCFLGAPKYSKPPSPLYFFLNSF